MVKVIVKGINPKMTLIITSDCYRKGKIDNFEKTIGKNDELRKKNLAKEVKESYNAAGHQNF